MVPVAVTPGANNISAGELWVASYMIVADSTLGDAAHGDTSLTFVIFPCFTDFLTNFAWTFLGDWISPIAIWTLWLWGLAKSLFFGVVP